MNNVLDAFCLLASWWSTLTVLTRFLKEQDINIYIPAGGPDPGPSSFKPRNVEGPQMIPAVLEWTLPWQPFCGWLHPGQPFFILFYCVALRVVLVVLLWGQDNLFLRIWKAAGCCGSQLWAGGTTGLVKNQGTTCVPTDKQAWVAQSSVFHALYLPLAGVTH